MCNSLKLATNRVALVPICAPEYELTNDESSVRYAVKELASYLTRMCCAVFEVKPYTGEKCILIQRDELEANPDKLHVKVSEEGILLNGGKRGVIYAVYELLERLGCRFFTCTAEKNPVDTELEVPYMDIVSAPRFEYREHDYHDAVKNVRFAVKLRLNGHFHAAPERMGGHIVYKTYCHTFNEIIPGELYEKTHPEFYSEIDGKRFLPSMGTTQLCLTNPELLEEAIKRVRDMLNADPNVGIFSISQNDWWNNCQCAACRASDEAEGSPAGTLLKFVNAIAERLEHEFPNVLFDTLAYQYTRHVPQSTRNRHNVCIRLCSIESCFSHPLGKCTDELHGGTEKSYHFIDDLHAWGKSNDRLYIWDYTTCFGHYPMPFPNYRVLKPNLITFAENNVKGIFEQACSASKGSTDFNELKLYLFSKLMWDPYCDIEQHRREFMEFYYGDAAESLIKYQDLLCDTVENENVHIHLWDDPVKAHLTDEMIEKYEALFDEAARAVANDPLRLWRVGKARLSIRWVKIVRDTMLRDKYEPEIIGEFFNDWKAYGLSMINEGVHFESTMRAMIGGKWNADKPFLSYGILEEPEVF